MGDRVAASVKTPAEELLESIAVELKVFHASSQLVESPQKELGLFAAFVDSMAHDFRDPAPTVQKLRKLSDAIGNVAVLVSDAQLSELLASQKVRIQHFLTQTPPDSDVRAVMIIADAAPIRGLLRTVLERHGFIVHAVADELDALTMLEREHYCVIIVDLTTRRVSGTDIIHRLSARNVSAPVLVTTSGNESMYDFSSSAVRAVLKKPFDVERLAQIATELCDETKMMEASRAR
jgi:CheY-like chemotaxis protein